MHETEDDLLELQTLIDRSMAGAGEHLRTIFRPPEHTISARQLAALFQSARQVAVGTVNGRGEPRVAHVDAILLLGRFHFGTDAGSARIRHLRARPALSLAYFEGDDLAVLVHGTGTIIGEGDPG